MADAPTQTLDVDTLVRATLNSMTSGDRPSRIVDLTGDIAHYLSRAGVAITLDGEPFDPGRESNVSWRRLIKLRGLLDD